MTFGQKYIPFRQFRGAIVPEPLLRSRGVSMGACVLFGQLARYAGQDGACYPKQARLARDLASSMRSVQRWLAELVGLRLVRAVHRGDGRSNEYEFLWNALLDPTARGQMLLEFDPSCFAASNEGPKPETAASAKPVHIQQERRQIGGSEAGPSLSEEGHFVFPTSHIVVASSNSGCEKPSREGNANPPAGPYLVPNPVHQTTARETERPRPRTAGVCPATRAQPPALPPSEPRPRLEADRPDERAQRLKTPSSGLPGQTQVLIGDCWYLVPSQPNHRIPPLTTADP